MKTRSGYVSNSSSSSFLVMCNDLRVFDFLKEEKGYETFMIDMQKDNNNDIRIKEFLASDFEKKLCDYRWYLQSVRRGWTSFDEVNPVVAFSGICHRIHNENQKVNKIIEEGVKMIREVSLDENAMLDGDRMSKLARQFAELLYDEAKCHWNIISTFGYADEDGGFWDYMEHDFMYTEVGGNEDKTFEDFALIIKSEH